jgi:hypothetical protein
VVLTWLTLILLLPAAIIVLVTLTLVADMWTSRGDPGPLRETVKDRFYPVLEQLGYRRKSTALTSTFRRVVGNRVRIVELRWDKYQRPSFGVSFGETANTILSTPYGEVSPEAVETHHSEALGDLQRSDRHTASNAWFKLRKPIEQVLATRRLRYEPSEVVDQLISTYPEVERWFEARETGPHIRMTRVETAQPCSGRRH